MNPGKSIFSVHQVVFIAVLLCSGYLIFKNLGDAALWSDEAETAIIAGNFVKTGRFTGWDGRNLLAIPNVTDLHKNLVDHNAPVQFALTALSFSLLGKTTFSARFPFAVIGLLTLILLYITLRRELPGHPAFALYATAFFGLFTDYILYMRNCRYYSIACFAALLVFFAYRNYMRRCDMKSAVGLAAAAVLLYYSHFQIAVAFLVPLAGIHLFFEHKRLPGKQWPQLLFVCFLFLLSTLPYTAAFRIWERPDLPQVGSFSDRINILSWFLEDSLGTGIAPWTIVATALIMILTRVFGPQTMHIMKFAVALLLAHIIFIALTSLQSAPKYFPVAKPIGFFSSFRLPSRNPPSFPYRGRFRGRVL